MNWRNIIRKFETYYSRITLPKDCSLEVKHAYTCALAREKVLIIAMKQKTAGKIKNRFVFAAGDLILGLRNSLEELEKSSNDPQNLEAFDGAFKCCLEIEYFFFPERKPRNEKGNQPGDF